MGAFPASLKNSLRYSYYLLVVLSNVSFYVAALLLLFVLFAFADSEGGSTGALASALVKIMVFAAELVALVFVLLAIVLFVFASLGPIGILALAFLLFVIVGWQQSANFVVVSIAFLALILVIF